MGKNIIINNKLLLYHPSWQAWSTLVFIGLKIHAVNYHVKFWILQQGWCNNFDWVGKHIGKKNPGLNIFWKGDHCNFLMWDFTTILYYALLTYIFISDFIPPRICEYFSHSFCASRGFQSISPRILSLRRVTSQDSTQS